MPYSMCQPLPTRLTGCWLIDRDPETIVFTPRGKVGIVALKIRSGGCFWETRKCQQVNKIDCFSVGLPRSQCNIVFGAINLLLPLVPVKKMSIMAVGRRKERSHRFLKYKLSTVNTFHCGPKKALWAVSNWNDCRKCYTTYPGRFLLQKYAAIYPNHGTKEELQNNG